MANVYAVKTGNWSDTTIWNTGALPTSADDVFANTFVVTIDTDVSVRSIRTYGTYNTGQFLITSSRTVTCSSGFFIGSYGFTITSATGRTTNLVGNFTPPTGGGRSTVINGTFGTVNITGNLDTSNSNYTNIFLGEQGQSNITINVTGNIYGGGSSTAGGIDLGNATQFSNITGNLYSGTAAGAVISAGGGSIIDHVGACYAANNVPAISTGTAVTLTMTGPFYASANGTHGVYSPVWKWKNTSPPTSFYEIKSANLAVTRPLYTADSVGGNPAVANVRSGTVYGPVGELTGTCVVPNANSVAYGVPVDNTTGNAVLTAAAVKESCSKAVVPALLALG
jgi:hypothetical protein